MFLDKRNNKNSFVDCKGISGDFENGVKTTSLSSLEHFVKIAHIDCSVKLQSGLPN